jgi:site-specific recombinase XerD
MLGHRHLDSTAVYTQLLPAELKRVHRRAHPSRRRR